jgi:hypothetical protein
VVFPVVGCAGARDRSAPFTNAVMGQFLTGFASRIFIVALPTIAAALDADILGISWALIAIEAALRLG